MNSRKKKIIIISSVIAVTIAAVIAVFVIDRLNNRTDVTPEQGQVVEQLRSEAADKQTKAAEAYEKGDVDTALTLYREALTDYQQADEQSSEYSKEAPSPEAADIAAQIDLIEIEKTNMPTPAPQQNSEEFRVVR